MALKNTSMHGNILYRVDLKTWFMCSGLSITCQCLLQNSTFFKIIYWKCKTVNYDCFICFFRPQNRPVTLNDAVNLWIVMDLSFLSKDLIVNELAIFKALKSLSTFFEQSKSDNAKKSLFPHIIYTMLNKIVFLHRK